MARVKISPNDPCPCGKNLKYKRCCRGKVDWEVLLGEGPEAEARHLSVRGKNLAFLTAIERATKIDPFGKYTWSDIKQAVDADAVAGIHSALLTLWPDPYDLARTLKDAASTKNSLYVGQYHPDPLLRGVKRHSLYAERILLVDPFMHPACIKPEYNPLKDPALHVTTTLQSLHIWLSLAPWVREGIVGFVRVPGDFLPRVMLECMMIQAQRIAAHSELRRSLEQSVDQMQESSMGEEFRSYAALQEPKEEHLEQYKAFFPDATDEELTALERTLEKAAEEHPYFKESVLEGNGPQLVTFGTGANYEMAKLTAATCDAHLITDLPIRWKEIEIDYADAGIDHERWSPFAKALQGSTLRHLEAVELKHALRLRQQERLERMRTFLRRVWKTAAEGEPFDDHNVANLTAELDERIAEAAAEWSKIDQDLVKWGAVQGALTAGLALTGAASASFIAPVLTGAATLVHSRMRRKSFHERYPAGFFLDCSCGS